jgi:hypothetical protein
MSSIDAYCPRFTNSRMRDYDQLNGYDVYINDRRNNMLHKLITTVMWKLINNEMFTKFKLHNNAYFITYIVREYAGNIITLSDIETGDNCTVNIDWLITEAKKSNTYESFENLHNTIRMSSYSSSMPIKIPTKIK